jgi:hypothetical protein
VSNVLFQWEELIKMNCKIKVIYDGFAFMIIHNVISNFMKILSFKSPLCMYSPKQKLDIIKLLFPTTRRGMPLVSLDHFMGCYVFKRSQNEGSSHLDVLLAGGERQTHQGDAVDRDHLKNGPFWKLFSFSATFNPVSVPYITTPGGAPVLHKPDPQC